MLAQVGEEYGVVEGLFYLVRGESVSSGVRHLHGSSRHCLHVDVAHDARAFLEGIRYDVMLAQVLLEGSFIEFTIDLSHVFCVIVVRAPARAQQIIHCRSLFDGSKGKFEDKSSRWGEDCHFLEPLVSFYVELPECRQCGKNYVQLIETRLFQHV